MTEKKFGDTMKILVMSDSHGHVGCILDAVERELPDQVFFLGDSVRDVEELSLLDPSLPVCTVAGNCDGWSGGAEERECTVGGVRCYLTHGHLHHAKMGTWGLVGEGMRRKVGAVFFGHTHQSFLQQEDGLWLINPGTIGGVHNKATYAVVWAENGSITAEIRELEA